MVTVQHPIIALVGPTAVGKTGISLDIAQRYDCEIISVDSMQVYRFMDIGTAKIQPEEMAGIPHHLINIRYPDQRYDAAAFVKDATVAIHAIHARNRIALLVGGTGLYLKALTEGLIPAVPHDSFLRSALRDRMEKVGSKKLHEELIACDPQSAKKIHWNDSSRIIRALEIYLCSGISRSEHIRRQSVRQSLSGLDTLLLLGLCCDRNILYERINQRTDRMIKTGLEQEVESLLARGYDRTCTAMGAIGYRHMVNYLLGECSQKEMRELLARDTRRYAKRQLTWFKPLPQIEWFEIPTKKALLNRIDEFLQVRDGPRN